LEFNLIQQEEMKEEKEEEEDEEKGKPKHYSDFT